MDRVLMGHGTRSGDARGVGLGRAALECEHARESAKGWSAPPDAASTGSTSVRGLVAKPNIDILVNVPDVSAHVHALDDSDD